MHVNRFPRDHFGRDDSFFFSLVGQHGAGNAITDREDVRKIRSHLVVDENLAAFPELEAERLRVDAARRGAAADRHEDVITFDALGFSVAFDVDEHAALGATASGYARSRAN